MVEDTRSTNSDRRKPKKRKDAAGRLGIDEEVLAEIGRLSSTHGGPYQARRRGGVGTPLSDKQRRFLDKAVYALIRRAAEKEYSPDACHRPISLSDLPSLNDEDHSEPNT